MSAQEDLLPLGISSFCCKVNAYLDDVTTYGDKLLLIADWYNWLGQPTLEALYWQYAFCSSSMGYIYVIADGDATSTKYKLEYVHYTSPQRH